jgi:hypothetical protein
MNEKTLRVLKGYSKLDYSDRQKIVEIIKKYEEQDFDGKKSLREAFNRSLGPTSSNPCPCCGR